MSEGFSRAQPPAAKFVVVLLSLLETCIFVPTVWLEQQIETWAAQALLRVLLALLRLYPILRLLVICCGRCFFLLPFTWQWRCRSWLSHASRCPELRWGVAVALDMWFFLSTPLRAGGEKGGLLAVGSILLLLANGFLFALDVIVLLLLLLATGNPEVHPEVTFHRPRPIKWGIPESSGTDSTCAICLSHLAFGFWALRSVVLRPGDFAANESLQLLPCGHIFHTDCVANWLQTSRFCPMRCPQALLPPRAPELAGNEHPEADAQAVTTAWEMDFLILPGEVRSAGS